VPVAAGAKDGVEPRDHHQVADAVRRQFEANGGLRTGQHRLDPGQRRNARSHRVRRLGRGQIDQREGPEGAMVYDIRIGDGQDDAGPGCTQPRIEVVLQVDHVGPAVRAVLGVHAVIGGEHDGGAQGIEPRQIAVHHGVEIIRRRRARRGLVLDIVGGGQIHQIRPLLLHEFDPGEEHEFRQLRTVHGGNRHADALHHVFDAIVGQRDLVGLFGREADALHLVTEQPAQLVLRRDHRHFRAGTGKGRENRTRAQIARIVHHDFFAALGIEEIIAAYAMDRRRHAGHDRQIIGIGEARHDTVGREGGPGAREQPSQKGRGAGRDRRGDVLELTAVDADDDQGAVHPLVVSAVHDELVGHGVFS
jgi:hypothetical protein